MTDYSEAMSEISGYPKALSHAGSGGSVNVKTINIKNDRSAYFFVTGYIDENNCYNSDESAAVQINQNETKSFKYIMPSENSVWAMSASTNIYLETTPDGIDVDGGEIAIYATAQNGLTITVIDNGGDDEPIV